MDNQMIARRLQEYARFLEVEGGNLYRARAYRSGADTILRLNEPAGDLLAREGRPGLEALPGIGSHLSFTIDSLVRTGELRTLHRQGGIPSRPRKSSLNSEGHERPRMHGSRRAPSFPAVS